MTKPCTVPNCAALRVLGSDFCAVHRAMSVPERMAAMADGAKAARFITDLQRLDLGRIDRE